ncbi:MAG: sigma-54-dependent Fis family transcriptional regulator [Myxococcales bacterium]|nr:sigma-54-dependent Fis family transcriptional regulator [Myxococcales bacterium]
MSTPRAAVAPPAVLLVEDNTDLSERMAAVLRDEGYQVTTAQTARRAEATVRAGFRGVVLLDIHLPDASGLDLFHSIRALTPRNRVAIMTAFDDLDNVISATRAGAFDFITKGADLHERVRITVRNAFDAMAREDEVAQLTSTVVRTTRSTRLITQARQMDEVLAAIDRLAASKVGVLVTGPSGTGKEVVAHCIHESGPRATAPFIAVNCAGIPDTLLESELFGYERGAFTGAAQRRQGKFEAAQDGTIFLDEIGEMSLPLQAKVLRVLQDGRFERLGGNQVVQSEARIIAATNRDLLSMVRAGTFREDLYYRLAVFTLRLPPLTERRGDIPLLVAHFVAQASRGEGRDIRTVAPEVLRLFDLHQWPGNVRQLQNVVARAVVVCTTDSVALRDLPESFMQELPASPAGAGSRPVAPALAPLAFSVPGNVVRGLDDLAVPELWNSSSPDRLDRALAGAFPDARQLPTLEELEGAGIRLVMKRLGHNIQATARALRIGRATLYRRLGHGEAGGAAGDTSRPV